MMIFIVRSNHLSSDIILMPNDVQIREDWVAWVSIYLQTMEAIYQWDGSITCNFRFNVFSNWSRTQYT